MTLYTVEILGLLHNILLRLAMVLGIMAALSPGVREGRNVRKKHENRRF